MEKQFILCYHRTMKCLFLSPKDDNYLFYYSDLLSNENVLFVETALNKRGLVGFFYRLHISKKLNRVINLPFKDVWIKKYKSKKVREFIKDKTENCIVMVFRHSFFLFYRHSYEKWLKKINPNIKLCFMFVDIVDSYKKGFDMKIAEDKFDALFTFDREDSKKFGLIYYPHLVSFPRKTFFLENFKQSKKSLGGGVYFMGRAKNRLPLLVNIYKLLKHNGVRVLFEVVGVSESDQVYKDENFKYINLISYYEYLERCSKADFLLEVMQSTAHSGYTTRVLEAISLDKKLITNNTKLKNAPFYNKDMLSVFTSEEDFDVEFLSDFCKPGWNYSDENYSADALLKFINNSIF